MLVGSPMVDVRRARLALAAIAALAIGRPVPATAQTREMSRDMGSYVLFALEQMRTKGIRIGPGGGDVGVNGPDGMLSASSHNEIIGPQSRVVANTVLMSSQARCAALFANNVPRVMPECGPARAATLPIIAEPRRASAFPDTFPACGGEVVMVSSGSSQTVAPGTYGDLIVLGAGTAMLSGGDYVFCNMRAGRNAHIMALGATTIHVQGDVNLSNGVFMGPESATAMSADDITVFVNGTSVHFSGSSDVHTRLYAPNAMMRLTHGTNIEGHFVARVVRTERITAGMPTTTTTTTTTTLPDCSMLCGNGRIDPQCGEECDGNDFGDATCAGSGGGAFVGSDDGAFVDSASQAFLKCTSDCKIDRSGCPCGNGVIESFEECDPVASPTGCFLGETCTPAGQPNECTCTGARIREICGNCIDDDKNGLTDFEDPVCCPRATTFVMTIKRGRLRPVGDRSKLRLRSLLASSGLEGVNPRKQDVFLQIRQAGDTKDLLCLKVPAENFVKKRRSFRFRDKKHLIASAMGLDKMRIVVKKSKRVRFRAFGKSVQIHTPAPGSLQVTVAFHDRTSDANNMCSTQTQAFRTGRRGRLRAP